MLESFCQDNTFPSTKDILFPLSSRQDMVTRFFSKLGTYKGVEKSIV
jgi:hypothetical protein